MTQLPRIDSPITGSITLETHKVYAPGNPNPYYRAGETAESIRSLPEYRGLDQYTWQARHEGPFVLEADGSEFSLRKAIRAADRHQRSLERGRLPMDRPIVGIHSDGNRWSWGVFDIGSPRGFTQTDGLSLSKIMSDDPEFLRRGHEAVPAVSIATEDPRMAYVLLPRDELGGGMGWALRHRLQTAVRTADGSADPRLAHIARDALDAIEIRRMLTLAAPVAGAAALLGAAYIVRD